MGRNCPLLLTEMGEDACYTICCPSVFPSLPGLPYLSYELLRGLSFGLMLYKTEWASISSLTIQLSSWIFLENTQIPDHLLFDSHFILASVTLSQDFFCFPLKTKTKQNKVKVWSWEENNKEGWAILCCFQKQLTPAFACRAHVKITSRSCLSVHVPWGGKYCDAGFTCSLQVKFAHLAKKSSSLPSWGNFACSFPYWFCLVPLVTQIQRAFCCLIFHDSPYFQPFIPLLFSLVHEIWKTP